MAVECIKVHHLINLFGARHTSRAVMEPGTALRGAERGIRCRQCATDVMLCGRRLSNDAALYLARHSVSPWLPGRQLVLTSLEHTPGSKP